MSSVANNFCIALQCATSINTHSLLEGELLQYLSSHGHKLVTGVVGSSPGASEDPPWRYFISVEAESLESGHLMSSSSFDRDSKLRDKSTIFLE
ncbi:hypothetical protein TNCV_1067741 [Trichonephila clavipes]|nr:hypothetical protein TNCV_1067741 [Trichonephila clavipes]